MSTSSASAYVELGDQLSAFRQAAGFSQERLGRAVGYSRSSIANIEAGRQQADERFWQQSDDALKAQGRLLAGWQAAEEVQRRALRLRAEETQLAQQHRLGEMESVTAGTPSASSGIIRFYDDFVDIGGGWDALFADSLTLDLAIMYGATWRNTYRKQLRVLTERPSGRVRVVLPDPATESPLMPLYATMLDTSVEDFRGKVLEAVRDFQAIGPRRHVEIYLTDRVFRHAVYLFSSRAILGLYALCGERISTPAFLVSEGSLLEFMRVDFDQLIEHARRVD